MSSTKKEVKNYQLFYHNNVIGHVYENENAARVEKQPAGWKFTAARKQKCTYCEKMVVWQQPLKSNSTRWECELCDY